MSDTILNGDFTVYYRAENNQKRIQYSGTGTKYTVRQLYSALQDLFDELNQMDDEIPMTAQTPTEFTLVNGWFIDDVSTEFLFGGAITTNGWASNEIVKVAYTGTLVTADIGQTIQTNNSPSYSGTILDFNDTGATNYVWIRPTDPTTDLFDSGDGFTVQAGSPQSTGTFVAGTNATGEQLWANIFTIGSIGDNLTMYVVQDGAKITSAKATTDWWGYGQIDILVKVQDMGTEIDDGVLTVYARKFSDLYDHFEVDVTAGGRNPVPLATSTDLNNANGYRTFTGSAGTGTFEVDEIIQVLTDGSPETFNLNVQGVVTAVSGTTAAPVIEYYLIGDPLTDFTNGDIVYGVTSGAQCTAGTPADTGPALYSDISFTFTATTADINNGFGPRPYSITVDCAGRTLDQVYEYFKYVTRRGAAGGPIFAAEGIDGEQYIGSTNQIEYINQTGTFTEGQTVYLIDTDNSSGLGINSVVGTAIVVADHDDGTTGDLIVRATRSFAILSNADEIWSGMGSPNTNFAEVLSVRTINPTKQSPFGTFAGGTLFGAPGVYITNFAADQSYQLIDDNGIVQVPPNLVSITVSNTRRFDRVSVFRLDINDDIDKDEYSVVVGGSPANVAGGTTLEVTTSISSEAPLSGASYGAGGIVRYVDNSTNQEYRLRYTTYSGNVFTLFTLGTEGSPAPLVAEAGSGETTLITSNAGPAGSPGGFIAEGVEPGDLIRNLTTGGVGYVVSVDSATQLTTSTITGQAPGDTYEIGTLPVTAGSGDTAYVPFLDREETVGTAISPGSEFSQIIYATDIDVRVRVRQAGVILPFETDSTITSAGLNVSTIRNPDTIYQ